MKALRWLLIPISWLYGAITFLRNKLYDWGVLSSYEIPVKSIVVGNLSVGGTGKSPLINYLIEHYLNSGATISTLSRGYGRSTKGPVIAADESTADEIGDEPKQFQESYGDRIQVVVSESRKVGVIEIQSKFPDIDLVLLDDAFQHRAIIAGLSLLVTPYDSLFCHDQMLPTGRLREWPSGKKRADAIIITKSPESIEESKVSSITKEINFDPERVFFSSIYYDKLKSIGPTLVPEPELVYIITGIANPSPLIDYWSKRAKVEHLAFPDHYKFTQADLQSIHEKFDTFDHQNKCIITTEKDFMRLKQFYEICNEEYKWHYQSITIKFKNQEKFNFLLDEYYR